MSVRKWVLVLASAALALIAEAGSGALSEAQAGTRAALGNGFTFQGRLTDNAAPANAAFDFEFRLFDDSGNPAGDPDTVALEDVLLVDGLFTVELDFGAAAFDGQNRSVEVSVRPGASAGAFTALAPRQRLTAAPHALTLRSVKLETRPGSTFVQAPETQIGTAADPALVVADSATALRKGSLGVGTAAPSAKLHVVATQSALMRIEQTSDSFNPVLEIKDGSPGQTRTPAINFLNTLNQVPGQILYSIASNFMTFRVNSLERMRIDASGNVGIGDSTPDAKLDVETASGMSTAIVGNTSVSGGSGVFGLASAASGSGSGVSGYSSSTGGRGVLGVATAASGSTYGMYGESQSDTGTGVYGTATATTGFNYGVYGVASSINGSGVHGVATAATGGNSGVSGQSSSTAGRGVLGVASAVTGTNYGVFGQSSSTAGRGVYGNASATTGSSYGVFGQSSSTAGIGVYGNAPATTGSNRGTVGVTFSATDGAAGVFGAAAAVSGTTYGVIGTNNSPTGHAGYFENNTDGATVLRIRKGSTNTSGNFLAADRPGDTEFRVSYTGSVYSDGSYNCGLASSCFNANVGADLAERIDVAEALEPGDVAAIDPQQPETFRLCRESFSTLVAGVVSSQPAITMANNDLKDNDTGERTDGRPLLALAGRVPVKASAENGPIAIGDLLVASSTPGHAMRGGPDPPAGTVVGKALQALPAGTGVVTMLIQAR